jgi:hypothetical protein
VKYEKVEVETKCWLENSKHLFRQFKLVGNGDTLAKTQHFAVKENARKKTTRNHYERCCYEMYLHS